MVRKKARIYSSKLGRLIHGNFIEISTESDKITDLKGKVNLIITSPPFPLNKKKKYGKKTGDDYLEWFVSLAPLFSELLAEDGSLVIQQAITRFSKPA
jgi:site-specific DNA-methyltransferase (cytosine-N4-specific)